MREKIPLSGSLARVESPKERAVQGRRNWWHSAMKWSLLLFFPVGYLGSRQTFALYSGDYLMLSLLSLAAGQMLLTQLKRPIKLAVPIWILLGIFCVAYYLQFYLLASNPLVSTGQVVVERDLSESLLIRTYGVITSGFAAFCLAGWAMLGRRRVRPRTTAIKAAARPLSARQARSLTSLLLVVVFVLELALGYVSWVGRIAIMGEESVSLPYRMAGLIFYTRTVLLLALLLLVVWLADQHGLRKQFRLGVLMLVLHGAADALLRSSRSSLFFTLLNLAFLLWVTNSLTQARKRIVAFALVVSLLLFPVVTAYRYARVATGTPDILTPLDQALRDLPSSGDLAEILTDTYSTLLFRATGTDSLVEAMGSGSKPLGLMSSGLVTRFFNSEIIGVPPDAFTSYAPSLLGWFYLVGGTGAVFLGMLSLVVATQKAWDWLLSTRLRSAPVAESLFFVVLVFGCVEGTLDQLLWWLAMAALSVFLAERLLGRLEGRSAGARLARSTA